MSGATRLLGATSVVGLSLAAWLYLDNRALRGELAARPAAPSQVAAGPATAGRGALPAPPRTAAPVVHASNTAAPALPEPPPAEARMERRAHRTDEIAAMLGRADGETDAEYRARILPLISGGLLVPRMRADDQRKIAEDKAHVTPAQSARLDQAFAKVYGDVLDFTNKAIGDGQLSPYERNVSGWLEYAGGLGGILNEANGQIGQILDPSQVRTMYDAGFEWGEYLGVKAPWEQITPPPARPR
jgi:hypothetical protein